MFSKIYGSTAHFSYILRHAKSFINIKSLVFHKFGLITSESQIRSDVKILKKILKVEPKMKITKSNSVFFDLNTKFTDRNHITQIGAVHAASGEIFEKAKIKKESQASAIKSFIKWIKRVNNKDPVVLIAHNGLSFDKTVLETVASENGVHKLKNVVAGYADTMLPFRKKFGLEKCSMNDLAKFSGMQWGMLEVPRSQ